MKKLKELIVLYPSFDRGGATANLLNFMNECDKRKIKINFISDINKNEKKKFLRKNIKVFHLNEKYSFKIFQRFFTSINSIFKLLFLFKKIKSYNSIVVSFQSHIIPIIFCKIFGRKIIIRNSEDIIDATKYADFKFSAYIIFILKVLFYNFSDGIITNSKRSKKSLERITFKNKSKLIYNPYLKKINIEKKISRQNVILSVGRFCKQKNQTVAIKAFANFLTKFPNYKLVIIGDGKDKIKLRNICIDLKIDDKVKFEGWVSDPSRYYLRSKILLFPSLYEGLPNTLIDAVNFDLPCISSNCSGAKDILLKDSRIFSPSNNYEILSKKIELMILEYRKILNQNKILKKNLSKFLITNQVTEYVKYCNFVINRSI